MFIAIVLLITLIAGFQVVCCGKSLADKVLAIQLCGTAGVAILIILSVIEKNAALLNVALVLAVLATVVIAVFTREKGDLK